MMQNNGLGLCAHESSGELDESPGGGPECLRPCAWGDGNAAGPQTTLLGHQETRRPLLSVPGHQVFDKK